MMIISSTYATRRTWPFVGCKLIDYIFSFSTQSLEKSHYTCPTKPKDSISSHTKTSLNDGLSLIPLEKENHVGAPYILPLEKYHEKIVLDIQLIRTTIL